MRRVNWLLLAPIAAFFPVWLDYSQRLRTDAQAWAHVLAIAAGIAVLWRPDTERASRGTLALSIACTVSVLYAAAYWHVGAMVRCALALVSLGASVWWQRASARPWLGLALLMLGLPALGQIEELLGASVRISVAEAAAALVRMPGVAVVAEGTRLSWAGGAVDVDAPCSGLRMMWTGALVALLAVARFPLRPSGVLALAVATPLLIWTGNVLRCAALFFVESGIVVAPPFAHDGIGLVIFAALCIALCEVTRWLSRARYTWRA